MILIQYIAAAKEWLLFESITSCRARVESTPSLVVLGDDIGRKMEYLNTIKIFDKSYFLFNKRPEVLF
jgi:hypothetical protein